MNNKEQLQIGFTYHILNKYLDFSGTLLEILKDGSVKVKSVGTGKEYIVEISSLKVRIT